ncbi:META domain-containing protein [Neomegalonema perideroedes]|uniref:META domain-containing protein n=1 Tax=Neomegalonema perideroedes TaxID=217219 RepID=UPI0012FE6A30|nr:META domain-containing protein [Neomegalonema perideroedes]
MKNVRLLALAAATILSGCAQGGVDPFAGASAPPPADEPQYFVRYPDGTIAPVAPSVVAGFGTPPGAGVVYAPPLQIPNPGAQPLYHATPPAQPQLQAPVQTAAPFPVAPVAPQPMVQAPASSPPPAQTATPQPRPRLSGPPQVAYVGPRPPEAAPTPSPMNFPPAAPAPALSAAPQMGGGAPQMDPALAEALRRQGIDPSEVVGLEYDGGLAAVSPGAAPAPAPGPMAALTPPVSRGMAPVASPRDAAPGGARAPQTPPAPRPAAPPQMGGAPQMDPALAEALRRQGIDPSEVVGLEYSGGLAAVSPGAAPAPAPARSAGPVSREGATGAPSASPTPRQSPVRRPTPAARPAAPAPAPAARTAAATPQQPAAAPRAPAMPSATGIAGSSWRLAMLRGQPVAPGVELHFDGAENFAGGSGPCSPYSFDFTEGAGGALTVDGVGADPRACGRSEEEERYFTALNLTSGYRISPQGEMDLLGAGGVLLARFQPL